MKHVRLFKTYVSLRSVWNVCLLLLRSNYGAIIGEGPEVKAFEKEFGEKFGLNNVVAVNSGTSALELTYELAGIGEGDEVITPVFTAVMTNLPLLHRKAKVVFADIERDFNISIEDVKRKITPKTKAIVFVHFGGNNRGLKELLEITKEKNIILIEDAAQAIGSDFWGKADFTCVSLQAIKTLTAGDGGFLIVKDEQSYERAKRLRWFGYDREQKQKLGDTDIVEAGYKYHMNDITAAIGRGNLANIDKLISKRKKLMAVYNEHPDVTAHIWFALVVGLPLEAMSYLAAHGVGTGQHHYRNDKYTVFGGRQAFPLMDELEDKYFILPLHHKVKPTEVKLILKLLDEWKNINNL